MMLQELRMKIPYEFEQFVGCIYPVDPRESESLESRAAAAIEDWAGNEPRQQRGVSDAERKARRTD
jgi:hypothetical protein